MTDLFISYARADRERIEPLAEALEREGISVWWDRRISGGDEFTREIQARLDEARVVLVAWSARSVDSHWVADEATVGRDKGMLVAIRLDESQPRLGFRQFHAIDFSAWDGDGDSEAFRELVASVQGRLESKPQKPAQETSSFSSPKVPASNAERRPGRWRVGAVFLAAVVVAALWWWRQPASESESGSSPVEAPKTVASASPAPLDKSIAILPFSDLSPARDQGYLSDGIAEEIINALQGIENLKVTGRMSSFTFRDREVSAQMVGDQLGVAHILEGSVRQQGKRLRVTARLLDTADGAQLWSETYDGVIDDLFVLQENIAQSVTRNLKIALSGENADTLARAGTESIEAYELYLKAIRSGLRFPEIQALLDRAIELDPMFSRAWSRKASSTALYSTSVDEDPAPHFARAERYARQALRIDPDNAEALGALGYLHYLQRRFVDMEEQFRAAMAVNPRDPRMLYLYVTAMISTGRLREAKTLADRLVALEPLNDWYVLYNAYILYGLGEHEAALREAERASTMGRNAWQQIPGWLAAEAGEPEEAARLLTEAWRGFEMGLSQEEMEVIYLGAFGSEAQRRSGLSTLDAVVARRAPDAPHRIFPTLYGFYGDWDRALAMFYDRTDSADEVFYGRIWVDLTEFGEFRRSERMTEFAERTGLLAYWQAYGWPEACAPKGANPVTVACE